MDEKKKEEEEEDDDYERKDEWDFCGDYDQDSGCFVVLSLDIFQVHKSVVVCMYVYYCSCTCSYLFVPY